MKEITIIQTHKSKFEIWRSEALSVTEAPHNIESPQVSWEETFKLEPAVSDFPCRQHYPFNRQIIPFEFSPA